MEERNKRYNCETIITAFSHITFRFFYMITSLLNDLNITKSRRQVTFNIIFVSSYQFAVDVSQSQQFQQHLV